MQQGDLDDYNLHKEEFSYDFVTKLLKNYECPIECKSTCCKSIGFLVTGYEYDRICEQYTNAIPLVEKHVTLISPDPEYVEYELKYKLESDPESDPELESSGDPKFKARLYEMNKKPCIFLDNRCGCQITDIKPLCCGMYPITVITPRKVMVDLRTNPNHENENPDLRQLVDTSQLPFKPKIAFIDMCPIGEQIALDIYSLSVISNIINVRLTDGYSEQLLTEDEEAVLLQKVNLPLSKYYSKRLKDSIEANATDTPNAHVKEPFNLINALDEYLQTFDLDFRLTLREYSRDYLFSLGESETQDLENFKCIMLFAPIED